MTGVTWPTWNVTPPLLIVDSKARSLPSRMRPITTLILRIGSIACNGTPNLLLTLASYSECIVSCYTPGKPRAGGVRARQDEEVQANLRRISFAYVTSSPYSTS